MSDEDESDVLETKAKNKKTCFFVSRLDPSFLKYFEAQISNWPSGPKMNQILEKNFKKNEKKVVYIAPNVLKTYQTGFYGILNPRNMLLRNKKLCIIDILKLKLEFWVILGFDQRKKFDFYSFLVIFANFLQFLVIFTNFYPFFCRF